VGKDKNSTKVVDLLVEVGNADTVYRDLYLRRARQLLSATLDESAYRAIGSTDKEIEDLMRRSRSAVLQRNWDQAAKLSAQADGLRQRKTAMGNLAAMGKDLYDADAVAFDPFSPGKHLGAHSEANQPAVRKQLLDTLASLGKLDPSLGASYEKRRSKPLQRTLKFSNGRTGLISMAIRSWAATACARWWAEMVGLADSTISSASAPVTHATASTCVSRWCGARAW
jgi:hypothetical protein